MTATPNPDSDDSTPDESTFDAETTIDAEPFDPYDTDDGHAVVNKASSNDVTNNLPLSGVSTVVPEPVSIAVPNEKPSKTDPSIDQTVANSDLEQTVALEDGNGSASVGGPEQTVAAGEVVVAGNKPSLARSKSPHQGTQKASVMNDTCVTQTINPRDLSAEDAALWGNLSQQSTGVVKSGDSTPASRSGQSRRSSQPVSAEQPSRLSPAINRSLSETKLNLRGQVVSQPHSDITADADYRIVRLLGKGGMGNVYVARQGSLDRLVALKVIKPLDDEKRKRFRQRGTLKQVEKERRLQFISEAVVTGDLDHPNIVPIYDIAVTGDDTLFYSMKRVSGTPWSKAIEAKSRDENLDILLKVCDAIGLAHTRGVVHRDIKPENIMLGEFGVVMVMDWGLALARPEFEKLDSIHHSTGLGGSPAYMAPEMAIGPVDQIGPASDIYLLGATLFQIITGFAPHVAVTVSECLKAVASNKIREVAQEQQGELLQVALRAMATHPHDRYPDVLSFQSAIRDYRSHSESIALAARAERYQARAKEKQNYEFYTRAIFGFEEASALWQDNVKAVEGIAVTKLKYAEAAFDKGDYDLGISLLDQDDAANQPLLERLENGKRERASRHTRLALLRKVTAALLAFIVIGSGIAIYSIHQGRLAESKARLEAETQKEIALKSAKEALESEKLATANANRAIESKNLAVALEKLAHTQTLEAEKRRVEAEQSKMLAVQEKQKAIQQTQEAIKQTLIAEQERLRAIEAEQKAIREQRVAKYENYVSFIGLANARIEQNEFDVARTILADLKKSTGEAGVGWEWRWLWRQTTQAVSSIVTASPAKAIDLTGPTDTLTIMLQDGTVQFAKAEPDGRLTTNGETYPLSHMDASAVVHSPDHQSIYVGTRSGDIEVWDAGLKTRRAVWTAHQTTINKMLFIDDRLLMTASDDRTIRLWDPISHIELAACWNLGPVKDFAIRKTDGSWTIVAAVAENTSGRATVWSLEQKQSTWQSKLVGEFHEHGRPVISVALSPDGGTAVSGDAAGYVFRWNVRHVQATDYANDIEAAIKKLSGARDRNDLANAFQARPNEFDSKRLVNPDLENVVGSAGRAHADRVRVVRVSPDGATILTGGDDNVIQLWDAATADRTKVLRGHGGWILDADFSRSNSDLIVSTSADSSIRTWQPTTYVSAAIANRTAGSDQQSLHDEEILAARLNLAGDAVVTASRDRTAIVSRINPLTMMLERVAELRDDDDVIALQEGTTFIAQSLALDIEHSLLYIASADAVVRVWDFARGTERFEIPDVGLNTSLALARNGQHLLTLSSLPDAKALLWRVDPFGVNPPRLALKLNGPDQLGGHPQELAVTALAISADGSKLFTGDTAGNGFFWDGRTGKPIGASRETFRGYRINAAEFSSDGNELWVATDNQQLTCINVKSGEVLRRYDHTGSVTGLSVAQDNRFAITISEQTTVNALKFEATLWNLDSGKKQILDRAETKTIGQGADAARSRLMSVRFAADGRTLAVGKQIASDTSGRVAVWSINQSGQAMPVSGFEMPAVLSAPQVCVPVISDRVLTLNGDAAFLWDTKPDKTSLVTSYRANAAVHHASFSANGEFVITGSQSVKIWDVKQQRAVAKIESPHFGRLQCVEFSPQVGSLQFATCGEDGTVQLYEFDSQGAHTKQLKTWFKDAGLPPLRTVRFSADGAMLICAGDDGTVRLIRLDGEQPAVKYDLPEAGNFISAAFSADGRYFVVGSDDFKARFWKIVESDVKEMAPPIVVTGHAGPIEDVKILSSSAGPLRILTASRDKSARVWDPRIGNAENIARELLNLRRHTQGVTAVDATANGNLVITAGRDATLIVWPASDQQSE